MSILSKFASALGFRVRAPQPDAKALARSLKFKAKAHRRPYLRYNPAYFA